MRISRSIRAIAASQKSEGVIMVYRSYPANVHSERLREPKVIFRTSHYGLGPWPARCRRRSGSPRGMDLPSISSREHTMRRSRKGVEQASCLEPRVRARAISSTEWHRSEAAAECQPSTSLNPRERKPNKVLITRGAGQVALDGIEGPFSPKTSSSLFLHARVGQTG